ncbi:MAG: hypothetical protein PHQ35_02855 [Phycisphaerae bacterium]|nr:hypothetical protein [Phycisphaerae bacterium]MDD5380768.1 hypothetical protein [Phycisphaerae bacterium]
MEPLTILAQAAESSSEPVFRAQTVLDALWGQIITLSWLQAVIAISFGVVYLLYGWRIFKLVVVICFGLVGLFIGIEIGARFGSEILGGVTGLVVLGGVSIPLMRWAVSLLGAIAGGIITGGIWYAFGLPERYMPAGALIGIIAGGMISFIVFKDAVMLFTSFGGGILIITGLLALVYRYESIQNPPTAAMKAMLYNHHWFLPALLIAPTIIGIIVQTKFLKTSKTWTV